MGCAGDSLGVMRMYVFNVNREIHPEGLPPSYTIVLLFRLLPDSPSEPFDIWQIADKNNNPEVGVSLNRKYPRMALSWGAERSRAQLHLIRNPRCYTSIPQPVWTTKAN